MQSKYSDLYTPGPTLTGKPLDLSKKDGFFEAELRARGAQQYAIEHPKLSKSSIQKQLNKMSTRDLYHYALQNIFADLRTIKPTDTRHKIHLENTERILSGISSLMVKHSPYKLKPVKAPRMKQPKMNNATLNRMARGR